MRLSSGFFLLGCLLAAGHDALAVGKDKAVYVGGTLAAPTPSSEGNLAVSDEEKLLFVADKGAGIVQVRWKAISRLEYGQQFSRRFSAPLTLFRKGRRHFLTVTYEDESGQEQAAVFELGSAIVRATLTAVETRSGRELVCQDEEARKSQGQ